MADAKDKNKAGDDAGTDTTSDKGGGKSGAGSDASSRPTSIKLVDDADKDKGEDLAGKDTSKFSTKEMMDYIDSLKDENAKRRIKNKKLSSLVEENQGKLETLSKELQESQKRLSELDEAEKKKKLEEATEIERLQIQLKEAEETKSALEAQKAESEALLSKHKVEIAVKSRETMVERLLYSADFNFSSEYERSGFMSSLSKTDPEGNLELDDDEVIDKVKDFIKEGKKKTVAEHPGGGPVNRSGEATINDEIKALTSKTHLSPEDLKRLSELTELTSQADEMIRDRNRDPSSQ
jgi:hypothetical protein